MAFSARPHPSAGSYAALPLVNQKRHWQANTHSKRYPTSETRATSIQEPVPFLEISAIVVLTEGDPSRMHFPIVVRTFGHSHQGVAVSRPWNIYIHAISARVGLIEHNLRSDQLLLPLRVLGTLVSFRFLRGDWFELGNSSTPFIKPAYNITIQH